jgi:sulfatase modifying factor 1
MKRAKVGSVVFLSSVVVSLAAQHEGDALANDSAAVVDAEPSSRGVIAARVLIASEEGPGQRVDDARQGACRDGMIEVEGEYCPDVEQKCLRWIDPEGVFPRRCAEFEPTTKCIGKPSKRHFCIDKYEWPNRAGENPVVMKTWYEAKDACAGAGKRLCGDSEWTVACEGSERLPYPYGYERSSEACNIDKPHPDVNEKALGSPDPSVRDAEAKRLWQGEPSGSRPSCVSPHGVFDMTGNVDEWVVNESGQPFRSGLKGGYWGPVRDRCRPMTTVHSEGFSFYQIGFRCCADLPSADAKPSEGASKKPSGGTRVAARTSVGS